MLLRVCGGHLERRRLFAAPRTPARDSAGEAEWDNGQGEAVIARQPPAQAPAGTINGRRCSPTASSSARLRGGARRPRRRPAPGPSVEPVTGIEPACPAWEAGALPLSYTGIPPLDRRRRQSNPRVRLSDGYPDDVLLSDRDIRSEIDNGRVVLDPWDPAMIQPSSVDVRLDKYFRLFDNHKYPYIDPAQDQPDLTRLVEVDPNEGFVLHPGEFVLASTLEMVTLPDDLAARVEGKSSLGRLGLLTHATAGFVDPGFGGHVTLELSNVA